MADYYVSSAGNDSNDGSYAAPWLTIDKVNSMINNGGSVGLNNRVLFRRGDTFYGNILASSALSNSSPGWLRIGSYGDSAQLPTISGYKILNTAAGWTAYDANTWQLDYSTENLGITYTGNSGYYSGADVGFIKVDGVIYGNKKSSLGSLASQWDFYSSGSVLYVRSTAKPTTLAADVRCSVNYNGVRIYAGTEIADVTVEGFGGSGIVPSGFGLNSGRGRVLRCTIREIGGSYLYSTTRYGNGIAAGDAKNLICEYNTIHDVYDTAWSPQGGTEGGTLDFTDITYRRNLTYRCSQAEEYWYLGVGPGFVNCVSEYNTNLFSGYGWGADVRPDTTVRAAQLTYNWGNNSSYSADLTIRRNIYYDQNSSIVILPSSDDISISNADVTAALATLNSRAKVGQVMAIQAPWT